MSDARRAARASRRPQALTLAVALLTSVTFAQTTANDRLHLDHAEWDNAELGIIVPTVHLYNEPELDACLEAGADSQCVKAATYRMPFLSVDASEEAAMELERAYRELARGVIEAVDAEINSGPACHSFITCLPGSIPTPIPDIPCLLPRIMVGTGKGLATHLPTYYAKVEGILNSHLLFHVRSGGIFPDIDSVVAPTMDVTGDLQGLLEELASAGEYEDALAAAYRLQSLSALMTGVTPRIPHMPNQVETERRGGRALNLPGYRDYEQDKRTREELYDPNTVKLGSGIFEVFGAGGLRASVATTIAGDIQKRHDPARNSEAAAKEVLNQYLRNLVPQEVIDGLARRVQVALENAAPGEDLTLSLARALDQGVSGLSPTLFTEPASAEALAKSVGYAPPPQLVPGFNLGDGALTITNPFLYEHIGYAGFTQVTAENHDATILYLDGFIPKPGIMIKCFGIIPSGVRIPWPTHVAFGRVARLAHITVPEGYPVPHTRRPLTLSPAAALFE